jgi:hypothetical protein
VSEPRKAYEPMKDSYKAFIYAKVICPRCGFLMDRAASTLVVCPNYKECELSGVIFEAPSVELKRFAPTERGRLTSPG